MNLKKNILRTAAVLVITGTLLFSASCSDGNNPESIDGYIIANSEGGDYSFTYPDTWSVLRADGMYAIGEKESGANISVSSFGLSFDAETLSAYAESENPWEKLLDDYINENDTGYLAVLSQTYGTGFSFVSAEDCTVGGRAGKKLIYHIKIGEDDYHFASALTLLPTMGDTYLYGITYTAADEASFSAHKAVFDGVVSSFEFN